jgi:hypothetical protein
MTITLLCSTPAQAFEIESELIRSDHEIEVLNPYHEDPVIYASRTPDPDGMVRRAIVTLICRSESVLNLSGQSWIDDICRIVGIPVSDEYNPGEPVEVKETPEIEEKWCSGCEHSDRGPLGWLDDSCSHENDSCEFFKTFEDAFNGENPL